MKRVISLALVICLVLLLLTPAVYAFALPDDLVALDLQDYFVKSYMKADYMVSEYLLYADSLVLRFNNAYSLIEDSSYSFQNVTGSTANSSGFYVSFCDVPSGMDADLNVYDGNELFSATDIPVGSYLTFQFFFHVSGAGISSQTFNLVKEIRFFDSSGNELSTGSNIYSGCWDVSCSCCGTSYDDRSIATIAHTFDSDFAETGYYYVSCYLPEGTAYFSIAFGAFMDTIGVGHNISFSAGSCTLLVEGTPYPTQPTISYNWLDTGAATYPLGTTTGVPLQVNVTNPQSYGTYSYQWYSGQFNKYDSDHLYGYGTAIEGATSAVYMPPVDHLGTYWYYCVVGHTSGDNMAYTHTSDCLVTVVDPSTGGSGTDSTDPSDPSGGGSGDSSGTGSTDPTDSTTGDDSGGSSGDGSGDSSGDASTDPTTSNDDVAAGIEESNNWLENIANGIINLPQTIMDGIKGLFVPDAEAMAEYKDQWESLLSQRFGAIYESVQLIDDFASSLSMQGLQDTVTFPSVELDLAGTLVVFGGWEVDVVPDGFEFLIEVLKKIISIVATLAFVNAMRNKFEGILGGSA